MCRVQVISGDVRYERPVDASTLSDTERRSDTWLSCRAVLESDAAIAMEPAHRLRRVVPFAFGMGNAGFGRAERGLAGPAGH